MLRALAFSGFVIYMPCGTFAQPASTPPAFEVASIRPAQPQAPGHLSIRMSTSPARVNYTNVSLKDVIGQAYRVQLYQISGADWLASERFDIAARIPAGATKDQVPLMFQTLLADRFKLALHRETKKLPVYTLVVGKGGPKLAKAESAAGLHRDYGAARRHIYGNVSMAQLADFLSERLARPVLDKTGLAGAWVIVLDFVEDAGEQAAAGPSLFTAVREQLGLRLVVRKGPVQILTVDHAEKVPTDN